MRMRTHIIHVDVEVEIDLEEEKRAVDAHTAAKLYLSNMMVVANRNGPTTRTWNSPGWIKGTIRMTRRVE